MGSLSLLEYPIANLPVTALFSCLIGTWVLYSLLTNVHYVFSFPTVLTEIYLPRVYVTESSWLHRFTDKFRFMLRGHEAVQKGYKLVSNLWYFIDE